MLYCLDISVLYDDGINQEFIMTVMAGGKEEKIRSIRRCIPQSKITYFQVTPPPILTEHQGAWVIEPEQEGARVYAQHSIRINPHFINSPTDNALMSRIKSAICANTRATLQSLINA